MTEGFAPQGGLVGGEVAWSSRLCGQGLVQVAGETIARRGNLLSD